jgi:hypothetical protein
MYEDFEEWSLFNTKIRIKLLKKNFNQKSKLLGRNSNPISGDRNLSITATST